MTTELHVTDRLRLRRFRATDADAFATLNADAEVMRYYLAPLSRSESDQLLARLIAHHREHGFGMWAVQTRATDELIGMVGLHRANIDAPFVPCVEVGWRLLSAHWGNGYATEAATEATRVGFQAHGLEEILAWTASTNTASRRVMEKLGMKHDPADDFDHPRIPIGHSLRRHVLYRLRSEDWRVSSFNSRPTT